MAKNTDRLTLEQACHEAKCKVSLLRTMFANARQESFNLGSDDSWFGLDLILQEVEVAIDRLTGMDKAAGVEAPRQPKDTRVNGH